MQYLFEKLLFAHFFGSKGEAPNQQPEVKHPEGPHVGLPASVKPTVVAGFENDFWRHVVRGAAVALQLFPGPLQHCSVTEVDQAHGQVPLDHDVFQLEVSVHNSGQVAVVQRPRNVEGELAFLPQLELAEIH